LNPETKPALFISALQPWHTGGGALCTLAYVQALSVIHNNALTYIGPEFDDNLYFPGKVKKTIFVPERRLLSKLITLLQLKSVDRLSPFVENTAQASPDDFEIVYINDERAGRFAAHRIFKNRKTVTIFHNYRAEYQKSSKNRGNPLKNLAGRINVKNSNLGYRYSDLRIFLTEYDRQCYLNFMNDERLHEKSFGCGYFGTNDENGSSHRRDSGSRTVTINASLSRGHNVTGILHFLKHIWPQVVKNEKGAFLIIAGRAPDSSVKEAVRKSANIELVADPPVEAMDGIFLKTAVCVCTNLEGSGIKLRVAEALRRGIPAVCSRHCAIGYENIDPRVLKAYSSPEECFSHLLYFLSPENQKDIIENCLDEYRAKLSFDAGVQKLTQQLIAAKIL
jgi:hypothetical protein